MRVVTFGWRDEVEEEEDEWMGVRWAVLTLGTTGVAGFWGCSGAALRDGRSAEDMMEREDFLSFGRSVGDVLGVVVIAGTFMTPDGKACGRGTKEIFRSRRGVGRAE